MEHWTMYQDYKLYDSVDFEFNLVSFGLKKHQVIIILKVEFKSRWIKFQLAKIGERKCLSTRLRKLKKRERLCLNAYKESFLIQIKMRNIFLGQLDLYKSRRAKVRVNDNNFVGKSEFNWV